MEPQIGSPLDMETLSGTLEEIIYENEETGFVVASLRGSEDDGELVRIVGHFAAVHGGDVVRLEGEWRDHPRYGRQFFVHLCALVPPTSIDGIRAYLGSGAIKGIGPALAERIVSAFGEQTLDVIQEDPDRLLTVPGVGKKRVEQIVNARHEQRDIEALLLFLHSHGVSAHLGAKIHRAYGHEAIQTIRENPYRLAEEVWGIGFKTADEIARRLGIPETAPQRLAAGVEHALQQAAHEGHVFLPVEETLNRAAELLEVDAAILAGPLELLQTRRRIVVEEERVYLARLHRAEATAANRLRMLLGTPPVPFNPQMIEDALRAVEEELRVTFSQQQRRAASLAAENSVIVLTGGPGTGKTTAVRAIVGLFQKLGLSIALAAPTGRAAKRLSEITGYAASTIHRLLGFSPVENAFLHGADQPLDLDLLVVDEMSMVDIELFSHLLLAIRDGTHLVLVGDVDQLPSVGPGNVLHDLIASGRVPVVALDEIFRQAQGSLIVTNAHRVNEGEMPVLTGDADRDFFFIEEEDPEAARERLLELCSARLPDYYGLDPFWEIQVLSPMRRGPLGTGELNRHLQERLNPNGKAFRPGPSSFRVGDKVMQIVNNYDRDVFNGDIGQIEEMDRESGAIIVRYPSKPVLYELADAVQLTLAYCVTVHKSQGSEYPAVVLALHSQHYVMLRRDLLYTALTRAKRLLVIVGTQRALRIAVGNGHVRDRGTFLDRRLTQEGFSGASSVMFSLPERE